ncbi:recombination protein NinG [Duganella violaceipulchra]|uniref:Recombination protein NinG n=1 Tax=Duganella violaceipulchra TaxID=2849652 RepID=A0AA41H7F5_9BURK|nr:recombination protein NinG [Duganella violaceicalia]MBV6321929.1 recombination protein NinG [Duganella violaceicalia]MCP2007077.1 ribosomal protein L37AE/L43A [Duganella violaceicalia]
MRRSPLKPGTGFKSQGFARGERIEAREVTKVKVAREKKHKCAVRTCRAEFVRPQPFVTWCSPECGAALAMAKIEKQRAGAAKAERKADKEKLAKFKRKADHVADCQKAFNAWVRFRDRLEPCIDCGRRAGAGSLTGGAWDAAHYLSRGSHPHLRFDERNVFAQLKGCNRPGGTTAASFRAGVIARIGLAAVEALEADNDPRKYSVDQLIAMTAHYKQLLKNLKAAA